MLARGFKARANAISRAVRTSLELLPHAPLDPRDLAEQRGIPIVALSSFTHTNKASVAHLMSVEPGAFSACTVHSGRRKLIIVNDAHTVPRQAANLAHELAHDILEHPVRPPFDERGCRRLDQGAEAEADWLGPALLVSDEAALHVAKLGLDLPEAAERYGVSEEVMRFRLNVTAAYKRAA